MGLCTSRPMDPNEAAKGSYAHKQAVRMQNERLKTVDRQSTLVVQDPQDYSITRINGLSMKAIGNALMFPDKQMPCKSIIQANYVCRKGDQCEYAHRQTNLTYFLDCLNSAKRTMDICCFTITCNEIAAAVKNAVYRGVKVRLITDANNVDGNGSDIRDLNHLASVNGDGFHLRPNKGIQIRCDENVGSLNCKSKPHMHHKFCIIDAGREKKDFDANTKLMNGSFNWTRQAVLENQDNVMVLEGAVNAPMISMYLKSFNAMWVKYEPFILPVN